jgi:ferredoxin
MEVIIKLDDIVYQIDSSPTESILDSLIKNEIDVPYSCNRGYCTMCRCKLISGKVEEEEDTYLTDSERKDGFILSCSSYVKSNITIDFDCY